MVMIDFVEHYGIVFVSAFSIKTLNCRVMLCINAAIAVMRCPSVCLSVCLSVYHVREFTKTNKDILEFFFTIG